LGLIVKICSKGIEEGEGGEGGTGV